MANAPQEFHRLPPAAVDWVRDVFARVNHKVTATLSTIPTHHEPQLDMQFIAALDQTPAVTSVDGWTVYIETHFLGGRRHFYNWEVADIGLLVVFRDRGAVRRIKVGLLQSKRLYPKELLAVEDHQVRARVGFGALMQRPEAFRALAAGRRFTFNSASKYLAIARGSEQYRALEAYEKMSGIPVYYLLYNPVVVPWTARVPLVEVPELPPLDAGCRVVRAEALHTSLQNRTDNYNPTYANVRSLKAPFEGPHQGGWRLEHFVADEMLACREGFIATDETDPKLEQLFFARSGPISAAVAITVEAPQGMDLFFPEAVVD